MKPGEKKPMPAGAEGLAALLVDRVRAYERNCRCPKCNGHAASGRSGPLQCVDCDFCLANLRKLMLGELSEYRVPSTGKNPVRLQLGTWYWSQSQPVATEDFACAAERIGGTLVPMKPQTRKTKTKTAAKAAKTAKAKVKRKIQPKSRIGKGKKIGKATPGKATPAGKSSPQVAARSAGSGQARKASAKKAVARIRGGVTGVTKKKAVARAHTKKKAVAKARAQGVQTKIARTQGARTQGARTQSARTQSARPTSVRPTVKAGHAASEDGRIGVFIRFETAADKDFAAQAADAAKASSLSAYSAYFALEAAYAGKKMELKPRAVEKKAASSAGSSEYARRNFARFATPALKGIVAKAAKATGVSLSAYIRYFTMEAAKAKAKLPAVAAVDGEGDYKVAEAATGT